MLRARSTSTKLTLGFAASVALLAGFSRPASADLVYTLTVDSCTGGCGPGPFGTVTLHQVDANDVFVTVALGGSFEFVKTGAGDAIEFDAKAGVTLSGITSGFAQDFGTIKANAETFDYGITCTGCGNGGSNPLPGPLSFTASDAAGLSINEFVANAHGYFFAADILGHGNTGDVFAQGPGTITVPGGGGAVPEPATLGLLGAGLMGLRAARRKSS